MTSRERHLLNTYGITEQQYIQLLSRQQGCCGVCRRHAREFKRRLAVDHDHSSGELRGLLCDFCNRFVIGRHRAGTGGAELLQHASQYLSQEGTGWFVPPKKKRKRTKRVKLNHPKRK